MFFSDDILQAHCISPITFFFKYIGTIPALQTAARPKPQVIPLNVTASYIHVLYFILFYFFIVLTWGKVWRPSAMLICATCLKRKESKNKQHTKNYSPPWRKIQSAAYDTMEDHFNKTLPQMIKDSNSFLFLRCYQFCGNWSLIIRLQKK